MSIPNIPPIIVPEKDPMGQMGNLVNMMLIQKFLDNSFDKLSNLGKKSPPQTEEQKKQEAQQKQTENKNLNFLADETKRIEEEIAERKKFEDTGQMGPVDRFIDFFRFSPKLKQSELKHFRDMPPEESLADLLTSLERQDAKFRKSAIPPEKPPSELDFYIQNPKAWRIQKRIEAIKKILNPPKQEPTQTPTQTPAATAPQKKVTPLEIMMRINSYNQNRGQ